MWLVQGSHTAPPAQPSDGTTLFASSCRAQFAVRRPLGPRVTSLRLKAAEALNANPSFNRLVCRTTGVKLRGHVRFND
jgi:hypothetical protein